MKKAFVISMLALFSMLALVLCAEEPGIVIALYGTPCAGKSTLASKLQAQLPGDFQIVKKTKLVKALRIELLEETTGRVIEDREEISRELLNLSPENARKLSLIVSDALAETVRRVNALALEGNNVILDVCHDDPVPLERLQGKEVVKVLVYAPLSILIARDQQRKEKGRQSDFFQLKRLSLIVKMFNNLYHPTGSDGLGAIGTLHKKDLEELTVRFEKIPKDTPAAIYQERLQRHIKKAIGHFRLDTQDSISFKPEKKADLVVMSRNDNEDVRQIASLINTRITGSYQSPK